MIAKVHGRRARFCGIACKEGFKADRDAGAIYSAWRIGGHLFNPEEASLVDLHCVYCSAEVEGRKLAARCACSGHPRLPITAEEACQIASPAVS